MDRNEYFFGVLGSILVPFGSCLVNLRLRVAFGCHFRRFTGRKSSPKGPLLAHFEAQWHPKTAKSELKGAQSVSEEDPEAERGHIRNCRKTEGFLLLFW